jgi:hypothetical protein
MAVRRPTLVGAQAKRVRAQRHFEELEAAVQGFFEDYSYDVRVEPDPNRDRYVARLHDPLPIPEREWATVIGDCIHNLRSIFDYIAWELAGGDPGDHQTLFSVCDTQAEFEDFRRRRMRRVPPGVQEAIERMQPFRAQEQQRDRHFLRRLHLLDIADKHKLLTLTIAQPRAAGVSVSPEDHGGKFWLYPDATLTDGEEIAELVFPAFVPNLKIDVHPHFDAAFANSVGLGDRVFVLTTLSQMMEQVDLAVAQFDASFFQ